MTDHLLNLFLGRFTVTSQFSNGKDQNTIMIFQTTSVKDLPGRHIRIKAETSDLDFASAGDLAKQKAKELCADPMLLSWYQGKTGKSYPNLECGRDDKPAWIIYAESRGGDMTIDINDGDYIFIFLCVT